MTRVLVGWVVVAFTSCTGIIGGGRDEPESPAGGGDGAGGGVAVLGGGDAGGVVSGGSSGGGAASSGGGTAGGTTCGDRANDAVRLALAPVCAGCHSSGQRAYFESLGAFESSLVYDERFVKPGDPDGSKLLQMLRAQPGVSQMPPTNVGKTYAQLVSEGTATMTLEQLADWVRALRPRGTATIGPSPARFTVRRLSADEMIVSLMKQLGLELSDFVSTSAPDWRDREYQVIDGRVFVWPRDWVPGVYAQYGNDKGTLQRYEMLGGGALLENRKKDRVIGPSAMQVLVQQSQAWCKRAIEKPGNTAVLRFVTLTDTSRTNEAGIRRNLASLHLEMLGVEADSATIDALYRDLYLPLEAKSTKTAWTAVCADFVRHPQWLSY